jgi:hypothetical protein
LNFIIKLAAATVVGTVLQACKLIGVCFEFILGVGQNPSAAVKAASLATAEEKKLEMQRHAV